MKLSRNPYRIVICSSLNFYQSQDKDLKQEILEAAINHIKEYIPFLREKWMYLN